MRTPPLFSILLSALILNITSIEKYSVCITLYTQGNVPPYFLKIFSTLLRSELEILKYLSLNFTIPQESQAIQ